MQTILICELCSEEIIFTDSEFATLDPDRQERFRCDHCRPASPAPGKRRRMPSTRNYGVTVTTTNPDAVIHRPGGALEALTEITAGLAEGARITAISTPATIIRDMQARPRLYGGKGRHEQLDRYSVERQLLSKIGRTDLLPE